VGQHFAELKNNVFHHYAGVKCGSKIYCAPNAAHEILVIDLDAVSERKNTNCYVISVPEIGNQRYHGAVEHLDGNIYFNPSKNSRMLCLDPATEKTWFIGESSPETIFKTHISEAGELLGFCFNGDVLKTNVNTGVQKHIIRGGKSLESYGAMIGPNGKYYSYISNGTELSEFDEKSESFRTLAEVDDGKYNYAKTAGCVLAKDGSIWMLPAFGRKILRLVFDGVKEQFPLEVLQSTLISGY
jgi:outer membrane protein assembly factor BamB